MHARHSNCKLKAIFGEVSVRNAVLNLILGQFHQHVYEQLFCVQIPKAQKDYQLDCIFYAFESALVKAAHKMLGKLTPGVNFINILQAAFVSTDPQSIKKTDNLTVFFTLLGSALQVQKLLVKR